MSIQSIAYQRFPANQDTSLHSSALSWRDAVRRVEVGLNDHESCYKRIHRLRTQSPQVRHRLDTLLICPTVKPCGFVRFLCYGAKWTEEMGEVCADISTIVERLVRKTLSNGRNSDLAAVIGSGMGRLVTSHMNVMGLSVNKSAGAVLYGLSALMSMLALALSSRSGSNDPTALTPDASARQPQPDQGLGWSAQHRVSRYLENQKEHLLDRARNSRHLVLKRLASRVEWQISRHKRIEGDALPAVCRQSHCDYMWNNLHQYGVCTRVLMVTGHTLFQVTNRLFISWDKYAARLLNQTVLKRFTGELLGHRLSSCLMYAASAGLSIPASQLIVGLSTLGAAVCAATLVCFLMAKLAVALGDWKGNLQPTPKRRPVFHGS